MYEIIRNGHTNTEIGILVRERPSLHLQKILKGGRSDFGLREDGS